jgi:cysteine desulfurase
VRRIYLDHNATSPLRREARAAMLRHLGRLDANPSSVHGDGHAARMAIETARAAVAGLVGAPPESVVLTGGGTEANNLAIYGLCLREGVAGRRIVTSAIEHPSVLAPLLDLEERGFEVVRVRPDGHGVVDPAAVLEAAAPGTVLVALMLANNETGALQPVAELGRELRRRGIPLHCDAAQAAGKVPVDFGVLGADTLALAAHKLGGPQGTGALCVRPGLSLRPHLRGGGQEGNRRPGTESVALIAGFGAAAEAARRALPSEAARLGSLRDRIEAEILGSVPGSAVNAAGAPRVPNTSNLALDGIQGETLVVALDLEGVAVSAGSACSAGTVRRSHVLEAMGLERAAGSSIRVSLGPDTDAEEVAAFVGILGRVAARARDAVAAAGGGRR